MLDFTELEKAMHAIANSTNRIADALEKLTAKDYKDASTTVETEKTTGFGSDTAGSIQPF